ncbi:EAL domain-containing protein [Amphiplicatus metriothermophilus]|uniref:EAL domain, c-di-GMP-specific phosphodiesterase class I (Or its enzymatically inactive variant) n=1 Tax=Amphiplicatus metriothermophilus TaxID=1519374 RepID=A0A239PKH3_9PROT|nr:EAL domain-containing protein [Amphiplicatus metriothermophilus]MBB5517342.1 EAL domain-containing protein (putative c-di-GMP-specific phosphodiesterase class I) [Amphiplicatus metriothermophilus]SNT68322.1 EAL domain, c-di-GMP-specific phosphodiesterase class I (or its enzymatically inactive variant) [Amphiplicatus metriothermophilus]
MNLRQRTSRYGFGVMFSAGVAGVVLVAACVRANFQPNLEIALAAALVVTLIMHARLGFALSKAQLELDMMRKLTKRCDEDPIKAARKIAPVLRFEPTRELSEPDAIMLERVRDAIENDRLELYLQPIVSLPQRKIRYYEAFSRLRGRDGGILRPTDYLEAAERANKIGVIDNMILLRCVQAFRRLRDQDSQFAVFCNLSPATLFDVDFFNHFTDYLEINGDLAPRLIFEFTYPAVQMMHPRFEENLRAIARRGFAFSVDHVHTLDLDWEALRRKNFRYAKAPSALLMAADAGQEAAAKLRALRKRLADAGIDLVAEKIEYESSMPEILALGIDYGQGNLFGPPRPADYYVGRHRREDDAAVAAGPAPGLAKAS